MKQSKRTRAQHLRTIFSARDVAREKYSADWSHGIYRQGLAFELAYGPAGDGPHLPAGWAQPDGNGSAAIPARARGISRFRASGRAIREWLWRLFTRTDRSSRWRRQ